MISWYLKSNSVILLNEFSHLLVRKNCKHHKISRKFLLLEQIKNNRSSLWIYLYNYNTQNIRIWYWSKNNLKCLLNTFLLIEKNIQHVMNISKNNFFFHFCLIVLSSKAWSWFWRPVLIKQCHIKLDRFKYTVYHIYNNNFFKIKQQ